MFYPQQTASTSSTVPSIAKPLAQSRLKNSKPPKSGFTNRFAREISFGKKTIKSADVLGAGKVLNATTLLNLFKLYQQKLPTFGIGTFFSIALYIFLSLVHPVQVQNLLFANSYMPLLALVFLASLFCLSFLFLHTRRGLFASIALTLLVWIQITGDVSVWLVAPLLIGWLLICEVVSIFILKYK